MKKPLDLNNNNNNQSLSLIQTILKILNPKNNNNEYIKILTNNAATLFLLEPYILYRLLSASRINFDLEDFMWRFNLTKNDLIFYDNFDDYNNNNQKILTIGIFDSDFYRFENPKLNFEVEENDNNNLNKLFKVNITHSFTQILRIYGQVPIVSDNGEVINSQTQKRPNNNATLHVIYQLKQIKEKSSETLLNSDSQSYHKSTNSTNQTLSNLYIHLVVIYRIEHYFWIGPFDNDQTISKNIHHLHHSLIFNKKNRHSFKRKYEQIFDQFQLIILNDDPDYFDNDHRIKFSIPNDIEHLLSQLSTSRYIHCPPGRTIKWFRENNIQIDTEKVLSTKYGIIAMKSLMYQLKMQFWIVCGTLLGWYRQCHVTPYTGDTDFATWGRYAQKWPQTLPYQLFNECHQHGMYVWSRFGHPKNSLEFSFHTMKLWNREKLDLFFVYPNNINDNNNIIINSNPVIYYQLPLHSPPYYGYLLYPQYELCSIVLLGYKLLAPCEPEQVISAEYGTNDEWRKPAKEWKFYHSEKNLLSMGLFNNKKNYKKINSSIIATTTIQHEEFNPFWELIK